jgi:DNA-binding Lrp family transcriptional regulator
MAGEYHRRVLTAFLFIVCEPGAIGRLGRALADTEGIAEVYTTTGSADFIAVVRVPDLDALATTVTQHIAELPGIVRTDTHLAIRSYGRGDETAAFDIGVD